MTLGTTMSSSIAASNPASQRGIVFATIIGTTIEWYDFFYATSAGPGFPELFFRPAVEDLGLLHRQSQDGQHGGVARRDAHRGPPRGFDWQAQHPSHRFHGTGHDGRHAALARQHRDTPRVLRRADLNVVKENQW